LLLGLFTLGNLSLIFSGLAGHPGRREYVTAVGEIKTVTLSDGTVMSMNTDTSVYVDFEQSERRLYLLKGEIMISSAQDIKPFYVTTRDGKVVPIGTYFIVNQREQETIVSVYEGVVELRPMRSIQFVQLKAMQQAAFNTKGTMPIQQLSTSRALWLEHKIQATNSKLTDFIIELARYHRGVINVAPELAKYKVTGIFSITNIDKTLHHLSEILPIEITYYFKRWIYIKEKPKNLH
ncbi:FecR family protein, partial [Pseudoalteromonas sp. AOP7-A1-14]